MSVMRCSKCETMVDTDVEDYCFDDDICYDCFALRCNSEVRRCKQFSLIRLLKSLWRAIIDHAGTRKDEYGTRKGD